MAYGDVTRKLNQVTNGSTINFSGNKITNSHPKDKPKFISNLTTYMGVNLWLDYNTYTWDNY